LSKLLVTVAGQEKASKYDDMMSILGGDWAKVMNMHISHFDITERFNNEIITNKLIFIYITGINQCQCCPNDMRQVTRKITT
jgi:hypothetical protein